MHNCIIHLVMCLFWPILNGLVVSTLSLPDFLLGILPILIIFRALKLPEGFCKSTWRKSLLSSLPHEFLLLFVHSPLFIISGFVPYICLSPMNIELTHNRQTESTFKTMLPSSVRTWHPGVQYVFIHKIHLWALVRPSEYLSLHFHS